MTTFRRRLLILPLIVGGSLVWAAGRADAHIDPEPSEAQPGSRVSVGFTVEHGCAGSPTVQLAMRLPDGVTEPAPEPLPGWTGTVDANVITFDGGPLPADQALTFRVSMTLPPTPDVTIYFPFVQRCETGETRWISIPTEGSSAELDEPAPAMELRGAVATTVTAASPVTTPPAVVPTTPSTPASTETLPASTSAVEPSTTGTPEAPGPSEPTPVATTTPASSSSGASGTWALVASIAAIGVIAALATRQARRRKR